MEWTGCLITFLVEIYSNCGGYLLPVWQSYSSRDVDFLPVQWRLVVCVAETFSLCYGRFVGKWWQWDFIQMLPVDLVAYRLGDIHSMYKSLLVEKTFFILFMLNLFFTTYFFIPFAFFIFDSLSSSILYIFGLNPTYSMTCPFSTFILHFTDYLLINNRM